MQKFLILQSWTRKYSIEMDLILYKGNKEANCCYISTMLSLCLG